MFNSAFGNQIRRYNLLVASRLPCLIGVIKLHALKDFEGIGTQVFLVNDPFVADHESLHARDTILGWRSSERKSADHRSADDEIHLAEWGVRTLSFQNSEIISVKR